MRENLILLFNLLIALPSVSSLNIATHPSPTQKDYLSDIKQGKIAVALYKSRVS